MERDRPAAVRNVDDQECANCIYFLAGKECHRHPPVIVTETQPGKGTRVFAMFPEVPSPQWCGEWEAAE